MLPRACSRALLLLPALVCLAPIAARAVPITEYASVQPIDVCTGAAGTTSGCAPINNSGQNYATAQQGAVGFIDPATKINITDAIWAQAGISVAFEPAVQYPNGGSFETIQVASCAANGSDCMSPEFQSLSQQPGIAGNPPPTLSPIPPLSANPTTLNMFFVNQLTPPSNQPGTLYGLSWINNNGVAISSNTLLGFGARVDTLAHEIGHDLDLDHATFGAGAANNLMTAGNLRTEPAGTANALKQLAAGTVDQLIATQQARTLLSGFLSPIPDVVTGVTDPPGAGDFSVSFHSDTGRANESLSALTLAVPAGTFLEGGLDGGTFKQLSNPGDTPGIVATPSFADCTVGENVNACQSLTLTFSGTPFGGGDNLDYTVGVCQPIAPGSPLLCQTVAVADLLAALANGTYTYQFSDGYQTTSTLQQSDGALTADSWDPDPTIASDIYDPALLLAANMGQLPCTPSDGTCPTLTLGDGSPLTEGGQPVPEPPSAPLLLTAVGLAIVVHRRAHRPRARA
ncbi:MAG: hypothetical protein ACREE9_03145 [Stellaceae bacterium]